METIDRRRTEWMDLERAVSVLEVLVERYPLDVGLKRAESVVRQQAERAEARHFDSAMEQELTRAATAP